MSASTTPTTPSAAADQFEFEFHPLADKFPLMDNEDLFKLAADIKVYGLREPITLYEGKILDGRNRYRACKKSKYEFVRDNFHELLCDQEPTAFVISANIHRRHLTVEQKRGLLATLIKIDPTKSNRQIADEAKVDHKTVGAVRQGLEATGEVPQLGATTGKDGKKRKRKGGGGGGEASGKRIEKEKSEYAKVTDAETASKAYRMFEQHLLDALKDLSQHSSLSHAQEYANNTKQKLDKRLGQLTPVPGEDYDEVEAA